MEKINVKSIADVEGVVPPGAVRPVQHLLLSFGYCYWSIDGKKVKIIVNKIPAKQ